MTEMLPKAIRRLPARARCERGYAVLTAIALMAIMLGSGLAVATLTDTETKQSGITRIRETSFNLGEAALNAQVFALSQTWPGQNASLAYAPCVPATGGSKCPSNSQLMGMFPTPDTAVGATWRTEVRDNELSAPTFYSDAFTADNEGYDANRDDRIWVRAESTTRGKTRTLVALVRAETQNEDIIHSAILSGRLELGNNGKKLIVDNTLGGVLRVRCNVDAPPPEKVCMGYELGKGNTKDLEDLQDEVDDQIPTIQWSPTAPWSYDGPRALSEESLQRLKDTAVSYGTRYTTCPTTLTGKVVWLDHVSCSVTSNPTFNSEQQPGMLIVDGGTISFGGKATYHGVVYAPNSDNSSSTIVTITGNACVNGGVIIEGNGSVEFGNSGGGCSPGGNLKFNPYAYGSVKSIGTAGIVQNTWRELNAG